MRPNLSINRLLTIIPVFFVKIVAQYDRSYHLNSNNFADQLTRNHQDPRHGAPRLTEEERNRLNALSGIAHVDAIRVPHPDIGLQNTKSYVLTSGTDNSGDLSTVKAAPNLYANLRMGQDLTDLSGSGKNGDPFAERNRLFNNQRRVPEEKPLIERQADDMYDFSYLLRQPQTQLQRQKQLQAQSFEEKLQTLQTLLYGGQKALGNMNQNAVETAKGSDKTYGPAIENGLNEVKNRVQDVGSHIQNTYENAVGKMASDVKNQAREDIFYIQNSMANQPIVNEVAGVVENRFNQLKGNFQQYGSEPYTRQIAQSVQSGVESARAAANDASATIGRAIDRFDTNVPRYRMRSEEAEAAAVRTRVVLDPQSPLLRERASTVDDYLRGAGKNAHATANAPANIDIAETHARNFAPGSVVGGNSQAARMRLLVKDSKTPIEMPDTELDKRGNIRDNSEDKTDKSAQNYTTYPNFKADLFPTLDNQAKNDPRPATSRRLGPQDRFGGGTNEYREDLGRNWAINDRRPPWMRAPGMGAAIPTESPTELNRFAGNVRIESYAVNSPRVDAAGGRRLGDDLSSSDAAGHNQFGPIFQEYTTPTPYINDGLSTTVIGVPLYNGRIEEKDRLTNGPASHYIGSGINPQSQRIVFVPTSNQRAANIQAYHGPEEITGSRYRNLDEHFNSLNKGNVGYGPNRYVKIDLLNE